MGDAAAAGSGGDRRAPAQGLGSGSWAPGQGRQRGRGRGGKLAGVTRLGLLRLFFGVLGELLYVLLQFLRRLPLINNVSSAYATRQFYQPMVSLWGQGGEGAGGAEARLRALLATTCLRWGPRPAPLRPGISGEAFFLPPTPWGAISG